MTRLRITEIEDADVDAVARLWARCGLTRPWNDPASDIAFARSVPGATVLVGWTGDTIAASAMVGHDGHRGTVYYVSVDPDRRGNGFGRDIMDGVETWLKQRGVWKLNLMVRSDNDKVVEFYRSLGYETEERINLSKRLDPVRRPG